MAAISKRSVDEIYNEAMAIFNAYPRALGYSDKEFGYLSQATDEVDIGYYKKDPDGDYQEELAASGLKMSAKEAVDYLRSRLNNIVDEVGQAAYDNVLKIANVPKAKAEDGVSLHDYQGLAKTNFWGLEAADIQAIEEDGNFDSGGHWNFSKVSGAPVGEYEAVYDGNYMHVFGSLEDLMARENEVKYYEYDSEKSDENDEETFVDSEGNEREYDNDEEAGDGADLMHDFNHWDYIEKNLNNYSRSSDVLYSDDLSKFINGEMDDDDKKEFARVRGISTNAQAKKAIMELDKRLFADAVVDAIDKSENYKAEISQNDSEKILVIDRRIDEVVKGYEHIDDPEVKRNIDLFNEAIKDSEYWGEVGKAEMGRKILAYKKANGGFLGLFRGRSKSAINKDRKYFNKNEAHEVSYAKRAGKRRKGYGQARSKSAINKDRKYLSKEAHEIDYAKRTGRVGQVYAANGIQLAEGAKGLLIELWFIVFDKKSSEYKTIADKLDAAKVPFSLQNAVSHDASKMRDLKKSIDTFEVKERVEKLIGSDSPNFESLTEAYRNAGWAANGKKINELDLEWFDGGDGVEYEVWKDKNTNQLYKVPIERLSSPEEEETGDINIERDFDNAEPVRSLFAAKFGDYAKDGKDVPDRVAILKEWILELENKSGSSGMVDPRNLKAYDIETKSIHNVIKIDYDDNLIVMESKEYGRTRTDLDKVKLFFEEKTHIDTTPLSSMPSNIKLSEELKKKPLRPIVGIPEEIPKEEYVEQVQKPVVKVTSPPKTTSLQTLTQEVWAEAKGAGMVIISSDFMGRLQESIFEDTTDDKYSILLGQAYDWLVVNDKVLKSKPFMKKLKEALAQ